MKDTTAHLHLICEDWKRTLEFYKSEIPFFKRRLEEIATKNTAEEIRKQVEHFENTFIAMDENLDELLHDVTLKQDALLKGAKEKPNFINVKMVDAPDDLKDLINTTAEEIAAEKKDFYRFLSDHL
jgi:hypothetical protein